MNRTVKRHMIKVKTGLEQTVFRIMPDKEYLKLYFRIRMGQKLNLENPKTFSEKLQWLKLYDRRNEYTVWVDKYKVKSYIAEKLGKEYIVPLLGVWDKVDEIDINKLPEQFVLKTTHGSGSIVICRDRDTFDWEAGKKKLNESLKENYFYGGREWPYKNVKPRIISEQYLEQDSGMGKELIDFKFYCFNGVPKFLYVSLGFEKHDTTQICFCNLDYTKASFGRTDYKILDKLPPKPINYDKMIELAAKLSAGVPFLRVDFFEVGKHLYFSELTFTPCSGIMKFSPEEYDEIWGREIQLPERTIDI